MKLLLPLLFFLLNGCTSKDIDRSLQIKAIDEDVYLHTSFKIIEGYGWVGSNGLVVVINQQAVIIDTPWSEQDTAELLSWIAAQNLTVVASISTHFHDDRTAGIGLLNAKSVPTYTSLFTDEILTSKGLPTASHVFTGDHVLMFNERLEIYYPGEGHSSDNLVVWLPHNQLLFGGCLVRPLAWQSLGFTGDANVAQWADSINNIQSKFPVIDKVVPGHGEMGDAAILSHTIDLVGKH
ncbi:subclass B1 metallo-beta-lactamase [Marinicella litoralis]|uniref:beta-lactamase n=1 Tax=Marinicella litoralis TaxID=644220 RepID=A0A4R6XM66_9GAMM|nr:subclass B1 metallo-beta-lactamase [Marinicella litoralis]TDR19449.1 metallo-beta-lactamase class B/metallo-beta-lactamase class B GIM [Marinicella litoralis]